MRIEDMTEAEVEDYVARSGLDDDMFFNLHATMRSYKELLRKAALTLKNRRAFEEAAEIHKALED